MLDCGIVPTPTIQVMVQHEKAFGGIIVTSSHNPAPWNGLKFVSSDGLFLSPELCSEMFAIADKGDLLAQIQVTLSDCTVLGAKTGKLTSTTQAAKIHLDKIFALPFIDPTKVAAKKFKVCLDAVCGAGGPIMCELLQKFGCTVIELNTEPTGKFPHEPEPVPRNLGDLCKAVVENKADLGIAVDPDVDRCVLIDEQGRPLVEEYTLALAVQVPLFICFI